MYGRKNARMLEVVLVFLSMIYGTLVWLRKTLYALRLLKVRRLSVRVISIGNITLGGTGKTPAVISIAELLLRHGKRPVVLSRGYGRQDESMIVAVSDGRGRLADCKIAGDEPCLIGARVPGLPVVAGSDRHKAGAFALREFGPDTIILDDGFQHIRLERNLDIVLLDASVPFGNRRLFPAGILREPLSGLGRCQAVLITRAHAAKDMETFKAEIQKHCKAKIFTSRHEPLELIDITSEEVRPVTALRGTKALAFSGIAKPGAFISVLRSLGADVRAEASYPDHYRYDKSDLAALFKRAADVKASIIVTTEKDGVRLKHMKPDGIWALRIGLEVLEKDEWERMILGEG